MREVRSLVYNGDGFAKKDRKKEGK